jgi:hypothetical protein
LQTVVAQLQAQQAAAQVSTQQTSSVAAAAPTTGAIEGAAHYVAAPQASTPSGIVARVIDPAAAAAVATAGDRNNSPAAANLPGLPPPRRQNRSTQSTTSRSTQPPDPIEVERANPSDAELVAQIRSYLNKKSSPLAAKAEQLVSISKRNGVDPRLMVAISGGESSFGKNNFRQNNAWGWMTSETFETWEEAIDTVSKGLKKGYIDEGRTSIEAIQKKYCPVGASNDPSGLNVNWLRTNSQFYRELGGDVNDVRL